MEISTKNLKNAIKELNTVLPGSKVRSVGVKAEVMATSFGDAVEKASEEGIELPQSVIDYFNLIFGEDETPVENDKEQTSEEACEEILNSPDPEEEPEQEQEKELESEDTPEEKEKPELEKPQKTPESKPKKANKKEVSKKTEPKKEKTRKVSKVRAPKMEGVVAEACKLLKNNPNIPNAEILDELEIIFPDRTRKEMYSTVGHTTCIGRCMLVLFGLKVG